MTGPTHVIFGLASSIVWCRETDITPTPVQLLLVMIGSLAPDIDGAGSITQPGNFLRRFLPRIFVDYVNVMAMLVSKIVQAFTKHRGFFHWPLLAVIMIVVAIMIDNEPLFWFGLGYASHLFADACTMDGIPVFAPLSRRRRSLKLMRTGSFAEQITAVSLLVFVIVYGKPLLPIPTQDALDSLWKYFVERRR